MDQPALRVILDDRPLRRTLTGVGNYIAQLLLHVPRCAPQIHIDPFVFTHLRRDDWRERLNPTTAPAGRNSPRDVGGSRKPWWMRRMIQTAYGAVFRLKTRGYELYHEPNHVPVRSKLPTVTTIHDLSVLVHPEWHPLDRVKWYERDFAAGVRQTRHFIAASQFTKREMSQRLNVPAERITVTYQAPRADFTPGSVGPSEWQSAGFTEPLPAGFFLYVGTLEPRKNVEGLLESYSALPPDLRRRHPLWIVGAWGWKAEKLREKLALHGIAEHVRLLGYLHDPQLALLLRACTALVWPTRYEGFGLPPLEAMACGAAVLVSDVASLPEVVGNAGLLLPPTDTAAWAAGMRRVAEEAAYRERLRSTAIQQAAKFTWERFAAATVAAYEKALLP